MRNIPVASQPSRHRLIQAGVRGERVAVLLANSNDAAIAIFAAHAAGAQAVPLNPAYTASELGPILADAACKVIVCDVNVEPVVHCRRRRSNGTADCCCWSRRGTTDPLEGRVEVATSASCT